MPQKKSNSGFFDLYKDEDLDFVIDSYQDAIGSHITPPAESHARRKIMKKIAVKRAPHAVSILDQIENIVKNFESGTVGIEKTLDRLASISARFGDKNLHNGVMMKIDMLRGQKPTQRMEKPVAMFSFKEEKRPTLLDIIGKKKTAAKPLFEIKDIKITPLTNIMEKPKKHTKSKQKKHKKRKKNWDPAKDKHPIAAFLEVK